MADDSVVYTVEALASHWRTSTDTIYRMVRDGKLQAFRIGRELRFTDRQVRAVEEGVA